MEPIREDLSFCKQNIFMDKKISDWKGCPVCLSNNNKHVSWASASLSLDSNFLCQGIVRDWNIQALLYMCKTLKVMLKSMVGAKLLWFSVLRNAKVWWSHKILMVLKKRECFLCHACLRQSICNIHLSFSHYKQINNVESCI